MQTRKMLFIYNPCAGQKRIARKLSDVVERFCEGGFLPTVLATQEAGHARTLARDYAADYDLVVCAGGDGTLNETVDGILDAKIDVPIAYLPCGSTNDLAATLKLPRDLDQAAANVLTGKPISLDIGLFNQRHFVYTASFGAFTSVSYATPQDLKNVLGHAAYFLEGVKNLSQIKPIYAKIHTDMGDFAGDFLFGSISNTTSLAGILTLNKSHVQLDDGKFELFLIDMPQNAIEFSQILLNTAQQKYEGLVHLISVGSIEIETMEELEWTLDGEYEKGGRSFTIQNLQQAIRLIVPSNLDMPNAM